MNVRLLDIIEKKLAEREDRKQKESHYPSEVNSCIRQLWYKWKGYAVSNPPDATSLWKMGIGDAIHEWLAGKFKEVAEIAIDELPFKKHAKGLKHPISGRMDNVLFFKTDGAFRGVEVKTTFGRGIRDIKFRGPKEEHVMQVLLYFWGTDLNVFHLVYLGRDDGYRRELVYERKGEEILQDGKALELTVEDIINKFKDIEAAIKRDIPERPYKAAIKDGEIKDKFTYQKKDYKTDWQCRFCAYKDLCWGNEKKKKGRWYGKRKVD